jgi:uncharacterized protein (DUF4415 family)/uncharacterized DUF497 family protein
VRFEWDAAKSDANLRVRGFDFEFASLIFDGPTFEVEDRRREYGERRVVAIGIADGVHLTVVSTPTGREPRGRSSVASFQRTGVIAVNEHATTKKRLGEPKRPTRGRADLGRLRRMTEAEIRRTAPPELADLPADFWDEGELIVPTAKQAISLRVDEDVLDWFKQTGPRYQTRMNAVLRSYMARTLKPAVTPERKRRRRKSA